MATDLSMENFGSMIDNVIAGICFFEYDGGNETMTPLFINEGMFRMLGYSRTQGMRFMKKVEMSIIPEDLRIYKQGIVDVLKDDGAVDVEFRTVTGSGGLRWLHVRGNLYSRKDIKYTILTIIQDITERKNIELELHRQAERLHILSEAEGEQIIDYNAKTDVMVFKSSSEYDLAGEQIQNRWMEHFADSTIHEEDMPYYRSIFRGLLTSPKHETVEYRTRRFDDDYTWYQANLTSLLGPEGYVTRVVGRLINIHEKKLKELELLLRAEKDALTGLYNQGATMELIQNSLHENKDNGMLNALMIIDLDNFKEINDIMGHAQGDQVIVDTANALNDIFKGGDIVGRIGGDEFVVFMKNIDSISNADILANKVVKGVNFSFEHEGQLLQVTCSVGVAISPYHGNDYEELFKKADKAVYTAKANGKCGYRIYDAATTMAYHATRKNTAYNPEKGMEMNHDIEDLVMQVLFEDKVMESALKSAIELITSKYHFHRGYVCGSEGLPISATVQFAAIGYEIGRETTEHYELNRVVSEILYETFHKATIIHDYDLTAVEMHDYFQAEGIKSMFYYPITSHGDFQGAIIFENHEDVQLEFKKSEMEELRSLMRILEAHILQIGFMDRLQDFATQIAIFDNMDSFVYIVNPDTYELSFINKKVLMASPEVKIGDICYKALQHRDTPCENCIAKRLKKDDPHCRCTEELFNYSLRCWSRCSASWLECKEENGLVLLNSIDISEYFMG
ncbi:MAG: diguanylate cyclase [Lachnospiraceae bacterium]|nr:diguanylate cyclase [Lachnospiraceae bacterium]